MAKIAYLILAHDRPSSLISLARSLAEAGNFVMIHYDKNAPLHEYRQLVTELKNHAHIAVSKTRIRCGWGEWSLVKASLKMLQEALALFVDATHFYLMSGDCLPNKSAKYIHDFLGSNDHDYIESYDLKENIWIKGGLKQERVTYWHPFNERRRRWFFYTSLALQKKLGVKRTPPADLHIKVGSQWWCLRRKTAQNILKTVKKRKDITRFFRWSWVSDELFFQSLVSYLVPEHEIISRSLTLSIFSPYGAAISFYNDHYDFLRKQHSLFARKISPYAYELREKLIHDYLSDTIGASSSIKAQKPNPETPSEPFTNVSKNLFTFISRRGHDGRRFAPRFWEKGSQIGAKRQLMVICSKNHASAKRLADHIGTATAIPTVHFLFDEETTSLPDIGGAASSLKKRLNHPQALLRLLYDYWLSDKLVICLDPKQVTILSNLLNDPAIVRVLELTLPVSDTDLIFSAQHFGLLNPVEPPEVSYKNLQLPQVISALRYEAASAHQQLGAFEKHPAYAKDIFYKIDQNTTRYESNVTLARFLNVPADVAFKIIETDFFFES